MEPSEPSWLATWMSLWFSRGRGWRGPVPCVSWRVWEAQLRGPAQVWGSAGTAGGAPHLGATAPGRRTLPAASPESGVQEEGGASWGLSWLSARTFLHSASCLLSEPCWGPPGHHQSQPSQGQWVRREGPLGLSRVALGSRRQHPALRAHASGPESQAAQRERARHVAAGSARTRTRRRAPLPPGSTCPVLRRREMGGSSSSGRLPGVGWGWGQRLPT